MTVTVITRFPTAQDARMDAERVASLVRHGVSARNIPIRVSYYERPEKDGGGFGYVMTIGSITITCRAITRYCVSFSDESGEGNMGSHREEFEAVTVEQALEDARAWMEARIQHMRHGLAILQGPRT